MPRQRRDSSKSDPTGLTVALDAVPVTDGSAGDAPPEVPTDGGRVPCRYCGKPMTSRGLNRHEKGCAQNPEARAVGAEPGAVGEYQLAPEVVALAISGVFDAIAARRGPHWKLSDGEAESLGVQWKMVLDVYLPQITNSKWGLLVLTAAQTAIVIYPRIKTDQDARAKKPNPSHSSRAVGVGEDDASKASAA